MEAGRRSGEEDTLQSAFKKLRVDAESVPAAATMSEPPRSGSRSGLDMSGAKPKLGSLKDTWHSCLRKTSRGASRTQRRRRSKSPILHPPRFTYCGASTPSPLAASGGIVKQQRLAVPEPAERRPVDPSAAPAERSSPSRTPPLLFGCRAKQEVAAAVTASTRRDTGSSREAPPLEQSSPEKRACVRSESRLGGAPAPGPEATADFRALSELGGPAGAPRPPCRCSRAHSSDFQDQDGRGAACRCWAGVEAYSFTGLRDVISECERSLASHDDAPRTAAAASGSSPRSCSEQARAYIDDITIEDLSGYMEFYLYIPKKMSHMAEMMYT
ncbi:oxidative stress-responsive serine-rich protein 1 [Takifugu flavidus]|uniref:Oxidative stress-responsive serine-rich protein 1 n=1 Tax=Takifugu flavidus TaxID=433684 RepID=A0A5C6N2H8_9TELE|nr:oxidative stress-responsive serine-rich protein 1 [Takifugu flavidus]XP_056887578.1 oxidative stress-responsive serine-rich protein 1 [Takifugu flavidus]TWW61393.1 Oxidative stress-responsive serine-rich protein 1 [Takifugu flavidus]